MSRLDESAAAPEPVRPDEVYALAVEAWHRTRPGAWKWSDLTGGERDEWLRTTTPIIRAVLEAQRGL